MKKRKGPDEKKTKAVRPSAATRALPSPLFERCVFFCFRQPRFFPAFYSISEIFNKAPISGRVKNIKKPLGKKRNESNQKNEKEGFLPSAACAGLPFFCFPQALRHPFSKIFNNARQSLDQIKAQRLAEFAVAAQFRESKSGGITSSVKLVWPCGSIRKTFQIPADLKDVRQHERFR